MKKIIATTIASLAFIGLAYAGETEGTIDSVDTATGTVTLADGQTFTAGEGVDVSMLASGDSVKVTFEDGSNTATAIDKM